MSNKVLVTAGCSFSECINWDKNNNPENRTWPIFLRERINGIEHHSEAMGSQGNGLISRRIQYRVSQLLKTHAAKDILVGIMWTERDRFDFYFEQPIEFTTNMDRWIENPTRVADNAPGGWVICNPHWTHPYNAAWYRHYHNEVAAQIYTLEHIVNTQNFLKLHGVKYFMTTAAANTFNDYHKNNANCSWLWEQIDWTKWLPVKNEHEWVKETCPIPGINNFHPRPDQHEQFVEQVVMPWINQNNLL